MPSRASPRGSRSSWQVTSMGQTSRAGRALGLDLGDARIGVAVSDDERRMAVPVGTVHTGAPADLKAVAKLVEEHAATLVVIGLPLSMSGEQGSAAVKAESFA